MEITVTSWNVNGLRAAVKNGFGASLEKLNPDIIALQEVRCSEAEALAVLEPQLGQYKFFSSHAEKAGYSGVAALVKKDLAEFITKITTSFELHSEELNRQKSQFEREGRILRVEFKKLFELCVLYVPSGTSGEERQRAKYQFLKQWTDFAALKPKAKQMFLGDINICHKPADIHHPQTALKQNLTGFRPAEREWIDTLLAHGYLDSFRHINGPDKEGYTWWSYRAGSRGKNLGWRIDAIYCSNPLEKNVTNCVVRQDIFGSDHCPVTVTMNF